MDRSARVNKKKDRSIRAGRSRMSHRKKKLQKVSKRDTNRSKELMKKPSAENLGPARSVFAKGASAEQAGSVFAKKPGASAEPLESPTARQTPRQPVGQPKPTMPSPRPVTSPAPIQPRRSETFDKSSVKKMEDSVKRKKEEKEKKEKEKVLNIQKPPKKKDILKAGDESFPKYDVLETTEEVPRCSVIQQIPDTMALVKMTGEAYLGRLKNKVKNNDNGGQLFIKDPVSGKERPFWHSDQLYKPPLTDDELVLNAETILAVVQGQVQLSKSEEDWSTKCDPCAKLQTLQDKKECIVQLVDTINPSNIIVKLTQKESRETGSYSWFVLDKWKVRLASAQNASAVHLLLSFFEGRIDWKNSVRDKRCSVCNSKRSPETKMACSGCDLICHYYCCRPRFLEKPSTWSCATCNRKNVLQARAAKSKPKYVETDTEDEEEEEDEDVVEDEGQDETAEEAEQSQDSVDSDVFAADSDEEKHTPIQVPGHTAKKRRIVESDEDGEALNDSGELGRSRSSRIAKRQKAAEPLPEAKAILEKIKATRMYRTLQNVPQPRRTRGQNTFATLETIENGLSDYETFEGFVQDLRGFLDHAREYFENHNERKLDELDELLMSLNLPEVQ